MEKPNLVIKMLISENLNPSRLKYISASYLVKTNTNQNVFSFFLYDIFL